MSSVETRGTVTSGRARAPRWLRRSLTPRTATAIALILIVGQSALRASWVRNGYFVVDDYLFLGDIGRGIDDLAWYTRIHYGHFMPLSFGLVKIATLAGPFNWTAAIVEIVALQALAGLSCWWMLSTLFGRTWASLTGLVIYLTTAMTMPALMWWAVAINQLPHQVAVCGTIAAHIRYCRTRSAWWLMVALGFLTVGYTSYAKTPLLLIVLAALTLLWFSEGTPWHRVWSTLRRYAWAWSTYTILTVTWLVLYLTGDSNAVESDPIKFIPLAESQLFTAAIPALFGGPLNWVQYLGGVPMQVAAPPLALAVASGVLLALIVLYAWGTRERSLSVLWVLAGYFFASVVLVYSGRGYIVAVIGADGVGRQLQYLGDAAPIVALCAVALFVPVRGATHPIKHRVDPLIRLHPPKALAAALVILVGAGGLVSSADYAKQWASLPGAEVTQTGIREISDARTVKFADTFVAPTMLSMLAGDQALISAFFSPLGDKFDVSSVGTDLKVFDRAGHIRVADVITPKDAPRQGYLPLCQEITAVGRTFQTAPPLAFGLWLAVDYRSTTRQRLTIVGTGRSVNGLDVPAGSHRVLISAPAPDATVRIYAPDEGDLCVRGVRWGYVGVPE